MELSNSQIHLYLFCPAKYKLKYIDNIEVSTTKSIAFKKAIHKTISYFFFSSMGGSLPSLAQMKDKWANTWKESSVIVEDPMSIILGTSESHAYRAKNRRDQYEIMGIEMIHNFYHFNKNNPGNVIAVDQPYRVQIGNHVVTGNFELIREVVDADRKRYIEIVDFKTGDDTLDPFIIRNDFNMTIASYAFRELFQSKEDRMKYHYLKTGRDIITYRTKEDFNRAQATISGVAAGIAGKHFYPRQTFLCKTCEYRDMCDRIRY